jgi:ATP-binding cassette subfamily B protein
VTSARGTRAARARAAATAWWREAVRPRGAIARLTLRAGGGVVSALVAVNVLLGLAPVVFVVAMSEIIGRVPAAVAAGDPSAWRSILPVFSVGATAFIVQTVLAPVQLSLGELMRRRVDEWVFDTVMVASLRSPGIAPLEDPETLNVLQNATRQLGTSFRTPGQGCAGALALIARYLRLASLVAVVGWAVSWWAAAALLATVLVFRHGQVAGTRRYTRVWRELSTGERRAEYLRDIAVRPGAGKEIRIFGLTGWLADRYEESYRGWLAGIWRERRRVFLWPFLWFTAFGLVMAVAVFVLLSRDAAAGTVSLTDLALTLQAAVAALLLGEAYPESDVVVQSAGRSLASLAELRRRMAETDDPEPTAPATVETAGLPRRSIRFENVRFGYPRGDRLVLDGLDLELPAGRSTAVVGLNGAGKTTLVKLLTRLYEPTSGAVRADGLDLRTLPLVAWRRRVSVVFQDFVHFELSAADNIALGAAHVARDDEAVRRAARRAGVLEVLERLPLGLDTPLSRAYPDGVDLSGGQWQRVAIARSLYALDAGARVLVLDEPTAALDVRAEADFFDRFVELTRGATSLLISHRFSSVRRADRIVVIDGGRVIEQGSHDELVAAGGRYARLFALQAERFEEGAGGRRLGAGRRAARNRPAEGMIR